MQKTRFTKVITIGNFFVGKDLYKKSIAVFFKGLLNAWYIHHVCADANDHG